MKTTISRYDFERAFVDADRKENFSYEGLGLLFDYLEEYEASTGEEIELDVIALCRDYYEETVQTIADNYGLELPEDENEEDHREAVRDYLNAHTIVVGDTADGFVYACF